MSEKSTVNPDEGRPQFGSRRLSNSVDVYEYNAWDDVIWSEEMQASADQIVARNSEERLTSESWNDYDSNARNYWDKFYAQHDDKFFKARSWLPTEFPEIFKSSSDLPLRLFEVGCGTGSTTLPILRANQNSIIYTSDLSENAVNLLKQSLSEVELNRCHAFQYDVTDDGAELPFTENSLDYILLIFVLSAIDPNCFHGIVSRLYSYLKPGGMIFFRDYGRYDMAQLRFKTGKCLSDNFYARSDGTRVYFFDQNELRELFTQNGFEEVQNYVDRRLIVNRKRKLQMHRVWIQCKYKK